MTSSVSPCTSSSTAAKSADRARAEELYARSVRLLGRIHDYVTPGTSGGACKERNIVKCEQKIGCSPALSEEFGACDELQSLKVTARRRLQGTVWLLLNRREFFLEALAVTEKETLTDTRGKKKCSEVYGYGAVTGLQTETADPKRSAPASIPVFRGSGEAPTRATSSSSSEPSLTLSTSTSSAAQLEPDAQVTSPDDTGGVSWPSMTPSQLNSEPLQIPNLRQRASARTAIADECQTRRHLRRNSLDAEDRRQSITRTDTYGPGALLDVFDAKLAEQSRARRLASGRGFEDAELAASHQIDTHAEAVQEEAAGASGGDGLGASTEPPEEGGVLAQESATCDSSGRKKSRKGFNPPFWYLRSSIPTRRHSADPYTLHFDAEKRHRRYCRRQRRRKTASEETLAQAASHVQQLIQLREDSSHHPSPSQQPHTETSQSHSSLVQGRSREEKEKAEHSESSTSAMLYRRCRSAVTVADYDCPPLGYTRERDEEKRQFGSGPGSGSSSSCSSGATSASAAGYARTSSFSHYSSAFAKELWPASITTVLTGGQPLRDRLLLFVHLESLMIQQAFKTAHVDSSRFSALTDKRLSHQKCAYAHAAISEVQNAESEAGKPSSERKPPLVEATRGWKVNSSYLFLGQPQHPCEGGAKEHVLPCGVLREFVQNFKTGPRQKKGLRMLTGAFSTPRPDKSCGEDSFFTCEGFVGVADGVGEWGELGCNPRQFAEELMEGCKAEASVVLSEWAATVAPASSTASADVEEPPAYGLASSAALRVLKAGFGFTRSFGSSTALVAGLGPGGQTLGVANLGDSTLIVLRRDKKRHRHFVTLRRTKEQQHFFNCPYQLSRVPRASDLPALASRGMHGLVRVLSGIQSGSLEGDSPDMADLYDVKVEEGDLVLAATDGVFDNLFDQEIASLVSLALSPYEAGVLEHCYSHEDLCVHARKWSPEFAKRRRRSGPGGRGGAEEDAESATARTITKTTKTTAEHQVPLLHSADLQQKTCTATTKRLKNDCTKCTRSNGGELSRCDALATSDPPVELGTPQGITFAPQDVETHSLSSLSAVDSLASTAVMEDALPLLCSCSDCHANSKSSRVNPSSAGPVEEGLLSWQGPLASGSCCDVTQDRFDSQDSGLGTGEAAFDTVSTSTSRDCEYRYGHPNSIIFPTTTKEWGFATPPQAIARAVVEAALYRSLDPRAKTPFARQSRKAGGFFQGGKMDDITVVAMWMTANDYKPESHLKRHRLYPS